jgi:hypothetical protein
VPDRVGERVGGDEVADYVAGRVVGKAGGDFADVVLGAPPPETVTSALEDR